MSKSLFPARGDGFSVVMLAILLPACLLMVAFFPWSQHRAGSFTRTLTVTGPVALRVETGSGSVSVHSGGSGLVVQATVFARHPHSDANLIRQIEQNPPIRQVGNHVQVGPLPREWSKKISISYVITSPAATSANISSGSGDLDVDGLQGTVNASTGSGSVHASNLGELLHASSGSGDITARGVGGDAELNTGSGSITASGVAGTERLSTGSGDIVITGGKEAVRASTGSGSIRATGLQSDFRASTGSGDLDAQGMLPEQHVWDLGTGSGSIHLGLPASTRAQVNLRTDSGSIHTDIPMQVTGKLNPHHMIGTIGGGSTSASLTAHTGSGDIEIRSR